jgi:hypothetical protein
MYPNAKVFIEAAGKDVTYNDTHPAHMALQGQFWQMAGLQTLQD